MLKSRNMNFFSKVLPFKFVKLKIKNNPFIQQIVNDCTSVCRYRYDPECEKKINEQINKELFASYAYLGMAYYFNKSSVSLYGFQKMFLFFSEEEIEHARIFMNYQNMRGGNIVLSKIKGPDNCEWTPATAVTTALDLEKDVTQSILDIHANATKHNDPNLTSFLESIFIDEQYDAISELCNLYTQIKTVGKNEGIYILDKDLENKYKPLLKQN